MSALLDSFVGARKAQKMVRIDKDFYNGANFIAKEWPIAVRDYGNVHCVCI